MFLLPFYNKDSLLQSELENLSFMYTKAHDYSELKQRAEELYKEQEKEIEEVLFILLITIFLMLWLLMQSLFLMYANDLV